MEGTTNICTDQASISFLAIKTKQADEYSTFFLQLSNCSTRRHDIRISSPQIFIDMCFEIASTSDEYPEASLDQTEVIIQIRSYQHQHLQQQLKAHPQHHKRPLSYQNTAQSHPRPVDLSIPANRQIQTICSTRRYSPERQCKHLPSPRKARYTPTLHWTVWYL